ncbi:MAG: invasion associated locus B family protein [Rhizobiales bacterium]|nr:invasion associated locus B family protein [Hyphomicrobiales bacterium]
MTIIFKKFRLIAVSFVISLLFISVSSAAPRPNQKFDDWLFHCTNVAVQGDVENLSTEAPEKETCALYQSLAARNRPRFGVVVLFEKYTGAQNPDTKIVATIKMLAPLGILLTQGITLTIDGEKLGSTPLFRCLPNGCTSATNITEATMAKFIAGETATITIFLTPDDGIAIPIKLSGLKDGFAVLNK